MGKILLSLICVVLLSAQSIGADRFYVGVGAGVLNVSDFAYDYGDINDYVDPVFQPPGTPRWVKAARSDKKHVAAASAWIGYRVWKTLSVEAGGMTSRPFSRTTQYNNQLPPFFFDPSPLFFLTGEEFRVHAARLSMSLDVPLRYGFSVFGNVGYMWTKTDAKFTYHLIKVADPRYFEHSSTDGSFHWGVGLRYRITPRCTVEAAWEPIEADETLIEQGVTLSYARIGVSVAF